MLTELLIVACTVCDSPESAGVRDALIQDAEFARNLLAVVLPWAICFGIVALLHVAPGRAEDRR